MRNFATCASTAIAVAVLVGASLGSPAFAQSEHKGSLALPMPAPGPVAAPGSVAAPSSVPAQSATAQDTQSTETIHARSAHRNLKLEMPGAPKTETEAANSPLQGAGPPQGNPPTPQTAGTPGAGPLTLSPLQGAGPVSAREMLLGSASSLGTR